MDKLKQVLKDKIKQLPANKHAKATYLFAESVRKFLTDTRSIDTLDLLKLYHAGEHVSVYDLKDAAVGATYAANDADAAADANAATAYAANAAAFATYVANANANATATAFAAANAADAAAYAADASITIESQISIVDKLINGDKI
jgi:ATP phosphoribosyltransferase regulatory subunit HisZ